MPRVLYLIDTGGPGGAETVLVNLVDRLPDSGWVSRTLLPSKDWLWSRLAVAGADVDILPNRGSADLGILYSIMVEIKRFAPDLVHAHFIGSGVYGTLASSFTTNCPLVCTFHGRPDVDPEDRLLPVKSRILSRDRNRIVYVSDDLRRQLEPLLGVPHRLGSVVHNGVPASNLGDRLAARKALGAEPGKMLIGAVGNIRPAKEYGDLLLAARSVLDRRGDAQFVILGDREHPLWAELLRLQEDLGLMDDVLFAGFRENVSELIPGFDLFVSSSSTEGLPLSSLEAMAAGKPVVLTRCGGVPEIVENGANGLLVEPRSPDALAAAILMVLGSPQLADRLGRAAALSVREHFTLSAMVEKHDQLYRRLTQAYPMANA